MNQFTPAPNSGAGAQGSGWGQPVPGASAQPSQPASEQLFRQESQPAAGRLTNQFSASGGLIPGPQIEQQRPGLQQGTPGLKLPHSIVPARSTPAVPQPSSPSLGGPQSPAPVRGAASNEGHTVPARQPQVPAPQVSRRVGVSQERREGDLALDDILIRVMEVGASDLHLTTGAPPTVRISGSLRPLDDFPVQDPDSVQRSIYQILTQKQREKFEDNLELDFAYSVRGKARFRVNLYYQRDSVGAAFRLIPYEIKALEELGVPAVVGTFAGLPRGLVLVTGPTGSGKSTTLAGIIDLANRTRAEHIMTVEDPIEFLHKHKKALINQREVGEDTKSFANALKHVLRQDPDIILVGELRDLETISVALTAAETGHLVFATLHTQDAAQTIDRVIDVFPSHQQDQIRTQLASAIRGVVCQTLAKRSDTPGRVVATEVMIATPAIRNLIREGKTHQIYSSMQAGAGHGMHTMDQHLADLVRSGKISYETGLEKCHHIADYNRLTGRTAQAPQGQTVVAGNNGFGGN